MIIKELGDTIVTIQIGYRFGNSAIFLSDFRITHAQGKQYDGMIKLLLFGKKIGLFIAADNIGIWRNLKPLIDKIEPLITPNNLYNQTGPLMDTIIGYLIQNPDKYARNRRIGALGFLIDNGNTNHVFCLDGAIGLECTINPLNDGICRVIGTGGNLPDIENSLKHIASFSLSRGYDMETTANAMISKYNNIVESAGPSTYQTLGISPILFPSYLVGDSFFVPGRHIKGSRITTDYDQNGPKMPVFYDYSFVKKLGRIFIWDHKNKRANYVDDLTTYKEPPKSVLFDPVQSYTMFNPLKYTSNDIVYIINQWVGDDFVWRTVDKTILIKNSSGQKFCDPNYQRLEDEIIFDVTPSEIIRYRLSGKHGLMVPRLQVTFENQLKNRLFDHQWLSNYVYNYYELYT